MSPKNLPLWYKDCLELKRDSIHRRSSENSVEVTVLQETFSLIREISTCKWCLSLSLYQELKDDSKFLETLIDGGGNYLNLHNNIIPFMVLCSTTFPSGSLPQHLPLSSAGDGISDGGGELLS